MRYSNLKVSTRLAIGFALLLVLMLLTTAVGIFRLQEINSETNYIIKNMLAKERLAEEWLNATSSNGVRMFAFVKAGDPESQEYLKSQMETVSKNITELQKSLDNFEKDVSEKQLFTNVAEKRATYAGIRKSVFEAKASGKDAETAQISNTKMAPAMDAYVNSIQQIVLYQKNRIDKEASLIDEDFHSTLVLMLAISGLSLGVGIAAAALISRSVLKQLGGEPAYAASIAASIASGDLHVAVDLKPNDHGSMLFAMKAMRDNLAGIVSQVRNGTDTIATASSQIAAGNLDLSSRTEEQASSLEETASSMEELTSTVKQNADNARQANNLAMTASEIARKGGAVVAEVVGTMSAINDSSRKIVDIIAVIDGIAFQTNILALNAAVEAARAGEQGRGFAVVASEVRSLAQRSAAAAKEIKTLIGDSVEKVDVGAKLVDQAGTTMNEIVESVKRVTDIMGEITAASQEQTAGIEQINTAITQMDQVTQQNAALVEEAAAAAESLQDQAANLSQVVSIFKTGDAHALQSAVAVEPRLKANATSTKHTKKPMIVTDVVRKAPGRAAPTKLVVSGASAVGTHVGTKVAATSGGDWEEF